jgi:DNA polymerase III epsilon subunit-like protein
LLSRPGGIPLGSVTFVVIDVEATDAPAGIGEVTEVAAVTVRGFHEIGRFATVVNPGGRIRPSVVALTGTTHALVADAPMMRTVLPALLQFTADDDVLVAHNAQSDVAFTGAACIRHGHRWRPPTVFDAGVLARQFFAAYAVENTRLVSHARHFRTSIGPTHRVLRDAQATAEVVCVLMERLRLQGVDSLEWALDVAGQWEFAVVWRGRLVGTGSVSPTVDPQRVVVGLVASAAYVMPCSGRIPGIGVQESEHLLDWFEELSARLVECSQERSYGIGSAARFGNVCAGPVHVNTVARHHV